MSIVLSGEYALQAMLSNVICVLQMARPVDLAFVSPLVDGSDKVRKMPCRLSGNQDLAVGTYFRRGNQIDFHERLSCRSQDCCTVNDVF